MTTIFYGLSRKSHCRHRLTALQPYAEMGKLLLKVTQLTKVICY